MTYYMGLDLSVTATGLMVIDSDLNIIKQETIETKSVGKHWYDLADRRYYITNKIINTVFEYKLAHICIEDYAVVHAKAAIPIIELGGCVKDSLRAYFISSSPIYFVPPTTVKKFVTGIGNANKIEMATHITNKYGVMFKNDNIYDAYGLALFSMALDGQGNWTKAQQEMLTIWHKKVVDKRVKEK